MRKAKVDNRIGAVLLDINFPGIGWGKAEELREAIKDLRSRWRGGMQAFHDTLLGHGHVPVAWAEDEMRRAGQIAG